MSPDIDPERLYTTPEAAALIGIKSRTMRSRIRPWRDRSQPVGLVRDGDRWLLTGELVHEMRESDRFIHRHRRLAAHPGRRSEQDERQEVIA